MPNLSSKKPISFFRVTAIFLVLGAMAGGLLFLVLSPNKTVIINDISRQPTCLPLSGTVSNKTIILRVDDIQAYSWSETSKRMVIDAGELGIPLTLGIIPVGLQDDVEIITFLKAQACRHEIALHGLTHSGGEDGTLPEFASYTRDEAYQSISTGLDILRGVTSDKVVTWIPPLNVHSQGTIDALTELGFKYLSAEGVGAFDYDASTFRYDTTALVPPEKIVEACLTTFETSPYCIIMIHPQDFAEGLVHDKAKYDQYYLALLRSLKDEGVTFARLKDLPLETP
jgi:peptidoglycan/xylan/chitin deacetylase (PgdA/CDA1 family)